MSSSTKDGLKNFSGYHLEHRGEIEVKGKGSMHTYFLLGRDGFHKTLPNPADYPEDRPEQRPPPPRPTRTGATNEMDAVKLKLQNLLGRRPSSLSELPLLTSESSRESGYVSCSGVDNEGFADEISVGQLDPEVTVESPNRRLSSPGGILKRAKLSRAMSEDKHVVVTADGRKRSRGRKEVDFDISVLPLEYNVVTKPPLESIPLDTPLPPREPRGMPTSLEQLFKSPSSNDSISKPTDANNLTPRRARQLHQSPHPIHPLDMNNFISVVRPAVPEKGHIVDKINNPDSNQEVQKAYGVAKLKNTEQRNSPSPPHSSPPRPRSPKPDMGLLKEQVSCRINKALQVTPL